MAVATHLASPEGVPAWRRPGSRGLVGRQRHAARRLDPHRELADRRVEMLAVGNETHRDTGIHQQRDRETRTAVVDGTHRIEKMRSETNAGIDGSGTRAPFASTERTASVKARASCSGREVAVAKKAV